MIEEKRGWKPSDVSVAVQGFGNAGQHFARLAHKDGHRIVAVSDSRGGVASEQGFDVPSLIKIKQETRHLEAVYCNGALCERVDAENVTNEQLLELDVDVLIPAALENQVSAENVDRISRGVRIIAEGANGPIGPMADTAIKGRNIFVIPDLLANAGGVTCSYFEQVQSNMNYSWEMDEVLGKLDVKMTSAFIAVSDLAKRENLYMRDAAYVIAVSRVAQACRDRGWV